MTPSCTCLANNACKVTVFGHEFAHSTSRQNRTREGVSRRGWVVGEGNAYSNPPEISRAFSAASFFSRLDWVGYRLRRSSRHLCVIPAELTLFDFLGIVAQRGGITVSTVTEEQNRHFSGISSRRDGGMVPAFCSCTDAM